jgi:hypothetical protein
VTLVTDDSPPAEPAERGGMLAENVHDLPAGGEIIERLVGQHLTVSDDVETQPRIVLPRDPLDLHSDLVDDERVHDLLAADIHWLPIC